MVLESSRGSLQAVGARAHILLFLARAFLALCSFDVPMGCGRGAHGARQGGLRLPDWQEPVAEISSLDSTATLCVGEPGINEVRAGIKMR